MLINSKVERFAVFAVFVFVLFHSVSSASPNLFLPLVSQVSGTDKPPDFFYFLAAPRLLEYARCHQHSESGETETSPLNSTPKSCWTHAPTLSLPREKPGVGGFLLLTLCLAVGIEYCE